jgi:hypothetical protein
MITWHPHTKIPANPETAVIAIRVPKDDPSDVDCILLAEIYRFDIPLQLWVGELSGLLLKRPIFWWASEAQLLDGLPE